MRKDMAKVIVERPRIGSRLPSKKKGYRKYLQSTGLENLPRREPLAGRWKGPQRWLNEHLGPMRRFLRSNVGRPWNKVHQELCEFVSFDNAVQAHVLSHIEDYVHRHTEFRGRQIIAGRQWGYRRVLQPGEMYVCPDSKLLKQVRVNRSRHPPTRLVCGPQLQYLWRDNAWWEVRLRKRPDEPEGQWDVWLENDLRKITSDEYTAAYGGKLYATSKRPLKKVETKQLYRRLKKRKRKSSDT